MNIVKRFLQKINILKQRVVQNHADVNCHGKRVKEIKPVGISDVYCLTVPETGCFIANGMVIANCKDAERYVLYSHYFNKSNNSMTETDADMMEKKYRFRY